VMEMFRSHNLSAHCEMIASRMSLRSNQQEELIFRSTRAFVGGAPL
jgi:hypothetical protein